MTLDGASNFLTIFGCIECCRDDVLLCFFFLFIVPAIKSQWNFSFGLLQKISSVSGKIYDTYIF